MYKFLIDLIILIDLNKSKIPISKLKPQVLNILDLDIFNYLEQFVIRLIRSIPIHDWYQKTAFIYLT